MAVLDLGKVVPTKGTDYFTESEINEIIQEVAQTVEVPEKTSDLVNDSGFITKGVNDLTNYTLATGTGSSIELNINSSTYEMTLNLKNSAGTTISTGTVDLPLETMVVGATYDNENKKIVLTLKSGTTLDVPVGDLINGLQAEITSTNKLDASLVDDTLSTNKFVTSAEKTTWNSKQNALIAGNNITIENNVISASVNGQTIQYETMPTADSTNLGKIVQYTGATDSTYTNGYFYQVVSDGQEPATYSWENIDVQKSVSNLPAYFITKEKLAEMQQSWNSSWVGTKKIAPFMLYDEIGTGIYKFEVDDGETLSLWWSTNSGSFNGITKDAIIVVFSKYLALCEAPQYPYSPGTLVITRTDTYKDSGSNTYGNLKDLLTTTPSKTGNASISGTWTFTVLPRSTVVPTNNNQFTNKKYVDDSISSAIGNINTILATLTTPSSNGGE